MTKIARWSGRTLCVAGLCAWAVWLAWRVTSPIHGPVGLAVLALESLAVAAAIVLTLGTWNAAPRNVAPSMHRADDDASSASLAVRFGELIRLPSSDQPSHGADDTGEVACARRGLRLLDGRVRADGSRSWAELAWAVVAVEGMRRMFFVAALVVVLLSGRFPFDIPPVQIAAALLASQLMLGVGHWLLTGRSIRPGERSRWSMASIGAGFGDGTSRSGLPIRWATTMATIVVLNLAVALRGFSDRWTHGLGALARDERVMVMTVSWWFVAVGFLALRTLPQPSLGLYGATRRLEESSARRLALGGTLAVAVVGFIAGVLPSAVPA